MVLKKTSRKKNWAVQSPIYPKEAGTLFFIAQLILGSASMGGL